MDKIVQEVDDDKSGLIELEEFLKIIKNGRKSQKEGKVTNEQTGAIYSFFYGLTKDKLSKNKKKRKDGQA